MTWNMVSLSLGVRLRKDCCKKTQTSLKQPLYGNKNSQMKQENYGAFNQSPNFTKGSLKASKLEIFGRGKNKDGI